MPCAEEEPDPHMGADSLKTEEKTKPVDLATIEEDESSTLVIISTDPPVHQLGTGSNWTGECRPTVQQCSLERR